MTDRVRHTVTETVRASGREEDSHTERQGEEERTGGIDRDRDRD